LTGTKVKNSKKQSVKTIFGGILMHAYIFTSNVEKTSIGWKKPPPPTLPELPLDFLPKKLLSVPK